MPAPSSAARFISTTQAAIKNRLPSLLTAGAESTLIAAAYVLAAELGFYLLELADSRVPIWLTSGVGIAALTIFGWRRWPAIWVATMLAAFTTDRPLFSLFLIAIGNVGEALVGAYLVRSLGGKNSHLGIQSQAVSMGVAAFIGPILAASVGTLALTFYELQTPELFHRTWFEWWSASALGALFTVPFFIALAKTPFSKRRVFAVGLQRFAGVGAGTALLLFLVFSRPTETAMSLLVFPSLLLGAYYLKSFGLRSLLLIIGAVAVTSTLVGLGPFTSHITIKELTHLQLFLTAMGVTALFLEGFRRAGHFWMPAMALTVGWLIAAALFYSFSLSQIERDLARFNLIVSEVTDRLTSQFANYEDTARASVSYYRSSQLVESSEWGHFVDSLRVSKPFGKIESIGVILPLSVGDAKDLSRKRHRLAGLTIRPFPTPGGQTIGSRDSHYVVTMIEPAELEGQILGLDFAGEINRREVLELARTSGRLAASTAIRLQAEANGQLGFLLAAPIEAPTARSQSKFQGWVFIPVVAQNFFAGIRGKYWDEVDIFIFSDAKLSPESILFRSDHASQPLPIFDSTTTIQLGQRNFYIGWKRGTGFISDYSPSEAWVGFGGAIIGLFFATMLVGLRETNRRAVQIADEKTALLTERERSLQQIREQYALAVKGSNDGLWDWNLYTNDVYLSPRWKEMLGYSDADLENSFDTWESLLHPDDKVRALKTLNDYLESRLPEFRLEHRLRHKSGSYSWILTRGMALWDKRGRPSRLSGSHTDITAAKKTEVNLIEARESALAAARTKSEFLANMSHEIRTPLSGIIGVATLLQDSKLSEEQLDYIRTISQSADSLLSILNDILDFSKIEAGKLILEHVPFNLEEEFLRIYHLMRFAAEQKKLELKLEIEPNLNTSFVGDPTRLRQILVNLVSNAIKFSFKGQVVIAVRALDKNLSPVRLKLSVADEGIGIPAEMHAAIFMPFSQADSSTSREFGGTGLGLSICKSLVDLMDGKIGVDSTMGVGSVFWFEISLDRPSLEQHQVEQLSGLLEFHPVSARILLAEDNPTSQKVATAILRKFGLTVTPVSNGREAVVALQHENFDLVLMDCQMPELDGYQATSEIRGSPDARVATTPIVAMTANSLKGDREKCLASGMSDYLAKPVRPETLYAMICKWLGNAPVDSVTAPEHAPPPPTKVLDLGTLKTLASLSVPGEPEVLALVINVYLECYPRQLEQIQTHFQTKSWDNLRREVHSLKAASGGVGLPIVAHICQQIENLALSRPEELRPLINQLDQDLSRAAQALKGIFENPERIA